MERTPKYDDKIEGVRKMPHETAEEKAEKRDASALLRMEALFDNAQCAQLFVDTIMKNPAITREEFLEVAKQSDRIVHPDAVDAFIDKLLETREKILAVNTWARDSIIREDWIIQADGLDAYEKALKEKGHSQDYIDQRMSEQVKLLIAHSKHLKKQNIDVSHWLGQRLFTTYLAKTPEKPKGKIALDTTNPLALIMNFSDAEDYKRVDPKDNVGGFHQANQTIDKLAFPLIAVNANQDSSVKKHEVGHAENSILKNSVIKKPEAEHRRLVWSHSPALKITEIELLNSDDVVLDQPTEDQKKQKAERARLEDRLLSYALGRAKDELLANYKTTSYDPFSYKNELLERMDVYDYFKIAGLSVTSSAYERLHSRYKENLYEACREANYPAALYARRNLKKRYETFRWVLAQIPLEDWSDQLTRMPFEEEADLLTDLDGIEFPNDGEEPSEKRKILLDRYYKFLKENETGLLVPGLREIDKEQKAIIAEEAELERKRPDEALLKIWEEMEEYEGILIASIKAKTLSINEARERIGIFFQRRCEEEKIEPNQELLISYIEDHHWNSPIDKIRHDKLPGHEMYTKI
jgi:hypothetical protein